MKVYIVDNDPISRTALTEFLAEWGYEPLVIDTGEAVPDRLKAESGPALVLLDGTVAEMCGAELGKFRQAGWGRPVYVIAMAAKGYKASATDNPTVADDFVVKPVRPDKLRTRLAIGRRVLEGEQTVLRLTRELAAKSDEMSRMQALDGLTGIANRAYFSERLNEEWRRVRREEVPISMIMADIDLFKAFNETYGHIAGDVCLKKVAGVVAETIGRAGDFAARYGGEEFVVVLPNTDSLGTLVIAEAIRVAVAKLEIRHVASDVHRNITLSLGTATVLPDESTCAQELIDKAEQALLLAKAAGRNNVKQAF